MSWSFRVPIINRRIAVDMIQTPTETLVAAVGVALARDHLRSACRFARLAYRLECGHPALESGEKRGEHDSFVAAAIIFAGAFLDSEINYQFAVAATTADPNALPPPTRDQVLAAIKGAVAGRTLPDSVFPKYQMLLKLAGKLTLPERTLTSMPCS
jgi:hypothetical protein